MLRFFSTVLAVVAGLFVFLILFVLLMASVISGARPSKPIPGKVVLELDLRQKIADGPSGTLLPAGFGGAGLSVVGIDGALLQASKDANVKGLVVKADSSLGVEPGQAEEIRQAIERFKASGKFVISQIQDLTDTGMGGYYVASAADQIWMQPSGMIMTQGLGISSPYLKGTLDKLGVTAQVLHYYEYKTAMNPFIDTGPTAAEKEENQRLIQSIFDSFSASIAKSRKMTPQKFQTLLDNVPYLAPEAVKAGWVDKLGYGVDAEDAAKERAGAGAKLVDLTAYGRAKGNPYNKGPVIAFIEGNGDIVQGVGDEDLFGGRSDVMAGDTTSEAILKAVNDKDVKAIIFRVNSPGGSAIASDQIWNAVHRAREKKIPVVIDMAGVAASGGYWVSMGADKIIAEPTTLTGSIGVVGAKFVVSGLEEKLGVNVAEQSVGGDKVFMFSQQHPFTDPEWVAMKKMFDATYNTFVQKVAEGRHLPVDKVKAIAKGRVWTGADAKQRGLVDELGGLHEAVAAAKKLAGIAPAASVELRQYPPQVSFFHQLFSAFGASARTAHALDVIASFLELKPNADLIDHMRRIEASEHEPIRAEAAPATVH